MNLKPLLKIALATLVLLLLSTTGTIAYAQGPEPNNAESQEIKSETNSQLTEDVSKTDCVGLPSDLVRDLRKYNPAVASRPDLMKLVEHYYCSGMLTREQILELPLPGQVKIVQPGIEAIAPNGWWLRVSAFNWRFDWDQGRPHYVVMYSTSASTCTSALWNGSSNYCFDGEGCMPQWNWVDTHHSLLVPTRMWPISWPYPLSYWTANCFFN